MAFYHELVWFIDIKYSYQLHAKPNTAAFSRMAFYAMSEVIYCHRPDQLTPGIAMKYLVLKITSKAEAAYDIEGYISSIVSLYYKI